MKRSWSFSLSLGGSILVLALMLLVRMVSQPAQAATYPTYGSEQAIANALKVIRDSQMTDGGIASLPGGSDMFTSVRSAIAVVQAGEQLESFKKGEATLIDYLETHAVTYTSEITSAPGRAGMLLTAVAGANLDATNFGGADLIAIVKDSYVADTGAYDPANVMGQLWAIIGLSAAGEPVPAKAIQWLISKQQANGAWSFSTPEWADAETTAMVVVALLNSGHVKPGDAVLQKALTYIREQQQPNGGWGIDWNTNLPGNAEATAWVIQALAAAGHTPVAQNWMAEANPRDLLIKTTPKNAIAAANIIYGLVESPITMIGSQARATRSLIWANAKQDKSGRWYGNTPASSLDTTADAVRAYAAAGFDPNTVMVAGGKSPVQFLETSVTTTTFVSSSSPLVVRANEVGKMILAAVAAGKNPRDFGDKHVNLVQLLKEFYVSSDTYGNTESLAYAILGLVAADEEPIIDNYIGLVNQLLAFQNANGGWNYSWEKASSPSATGLALQALAAVSSQVSDVPDNQKNAVTKAKDYLRTSQDAKGGWGDTASTAMVIQGLQKTPGVDLYSSNWLKGGKNAYQALFDAQDSDGPFAGLSGDDDVAASFAAVQAIAKPYTPYGGEPKPFEGYGSYPDADRTVPAQPWAANGILVAPIGSDSNGNAKVDLEWTEITSGTWNSITPTKRGTGAVTSSVALSSTKSYKFRSTYTDPDRVQTSTGITTSTVRIGYLGAAETVIRPAVSTWPTQTLSYGTNRQGVSIVFPTQAVNRVTKFLYTPLSSPSVALFSTLKGAGRNFLLQAAQGDDLLNNLELTKPATITITYSDEDVSGLDESKLGLWYLDGKMWKDATESCAKATSYTRNAATNTLSVPVCRTAEFAMAGPTAEIISKVAKVTLTPDTVATIAEGSTMTITALVEDASSTKLAGQTVEFTKTGSSSIAPAISTSNSNGEAYTTLTGTEGYTWVYARSGEVSAAKPVLVQVLKQSEYANLAAPPIHGIPGETLTIPAITGSLISGGSVSIPEGLTVGGVKVARVSISMLISPTASLATFPANSKPMATILLSLYDAAGNELSGNLSAPITIVLNFSGVPAGYIPQTMRAFYFAGGKWTNEGIVITNPALATFTFTTSHASEFAVSIANKVHVYLPVVQR